MVMTVPKYNKFFFLDESLWYNLWYLDRLPENLYEGNEVYGNPVLLFMIYNFLLIGSNLYSIPLRYFGGIL